MLPPLESIVSCRVNCSCATQCGVHQTGLLEAPHHSRSMYRRCACPTCASFEMRSVKSELISKGGRRILCEAQVIATSPLLDVERKFRSVKRNAPMPNRTEGTGRLRAVFKWKRTARGIQCQNFGATYSGRTTGSQWLGETVQTERSTAPKGP
jgi:hypothetical protein